MTKEETLNLIFAWRIFWKCKKIIILYSLVAAIIAMIVSFILPKTYEAKIILLMPEISAGASGIASSLGFLSPNLTLEEGISSQSIKSILESETCLKLVIDKFDLINVYRKKNIEETMKILKKRTNIGIFNLSGTIELVFKDRDREKVAEIGNYYIKTLEIINEKLELTTEKPIVKVLDPAVPPLKKSFPKTRYNMIFAFLFVFLFLFLFYMFKEWKTIHV